MEIFYLKATKHTLEVDFNPQTGVLKMIGRSLPENATKFYQPLFAWLDEYILHPATETTIIFQFIYYNTGQSKYIFDIFRKLQVLHTQAHKVSVKWYYEEHDEDMEENGKDFKSLFNLDMELVMIPDIPD